MSGATLYVIGLGPGNADSITPQAREALHRAQCVAGYKLYVELVPPAWLEGKTLITTGMRKEQERCQAAIDAARAGKVTAMVCSGDAGVYGMSGLVLEMLDAQGLMQDIPVEVVAGVPAVCAAAALLGAPLMHDFACVSLSDLLTPWETIEQRLHAACAADFVLALYNPRSRGRDWQLARALDIAREHRPAATPVGLVRQAGRAEEQASVSRLDDFNPDSVDMLSLVIIGNSATRCLGGRMVTPRGYALRRPAEAQPAQA